jgi:hypothetical protein
VNFPGLNGAFFYFEDHPPCDGSLFHDVFSLAELLPVEYSCLQDEKDYSTSGSRFVSKISEYKLISAHEIWR